MAARGRRRIPVQVLVMNNHVMELNPSAVGMSDSAEPDWRVGSEVDDFNYTPVSPWGPIALVLGILSLTGFYGMFGLYIALTGTILGGVAVRQIRAARGTLKGGAFAWIGMVLSVLSLTLGTAKMAHAYSVECPEGFQRVNFPNDISAKQFVYLPRRQLHPDVAPLVGKPIFLKGFMWQTMQNEGLTEFVLLKDNGECCFGGKAQPYDMIQVKLQDGQTTRAYTGMVAVAGVLSADVRAPEDAAVYTIDATLVEEARTGF